MLQVFIIIRVVKFYVQDNTDMGKQLQKTFAVLVGLGNKIATASYPRGASYVSQLPAYMYGRIQP